LSWPRGTTIGTPRRLPGASDWSLARMAAAGLGARAAPLGPDSPELLAVARRALDLTNGHRAARGLRPCRWHPRLAGLAAARARLSGAAPGASFEGDLPDPRFVTRGRQAGRRRGARGQPPGHPPQGARRCSRGLPD
ncbi:unnamed protein product, partial [Prorocentrum cordatum]